MNYLNFRS
ncbi:hypothetical protein F383_37082 [Gossypium arboreum]|uniref:Uncharacterized protein n=1 Tax=Gossypium arboreum TaxID=29729 RepID=A0A0B0MC17_GOSAR|nr:hypothetical protein F383_37082 [Gossypium arboreum]